MYFFSFNNLACIKDEDEPEKEVEAEANDDKAEEEEDEVEMEKGDETATTQIIDDPVIPASANKTNKVPD